MKTYPLQIEEKLGIDQIRTLIQANCASIKGKQLVVNMKISSNLKQIELWLDQVQEFKSILEVGAGPPISNADLRVAIDKLTLDKRFLEVEEFVLIRQVCQEFIEVETFFRSREIQFPKLFEYVSKVFVPKEIIFKIDEVFDIDGQWKRNASKKLHDVLNEIDKQEKLAYQTLNKIYLKAQELGWTANTGITIKEGRLVLPVFAENKRKLNGIVHDESGGGKVLYIEPMEVLDVSNKIKELELERDREMKRILNNLTEFVRPHSSSIKEMDQKMGVLDFVRAKARFALKVGGNKPMIHHKKELDYKRLYHPMLFIHNLSKSKEVIPMDIRLDEVQNLMVVSGPNAGGKSVSIKTLATNQYLLQCGMLVPCAPESKACIFKQIFVDIGDSQSIENDLSSYSGHLTAMKYFIEHSHSQTLVVIDEIGSGTDPNFGGAMAEAVLITLHKKKIMGMVTTHFGNIKTLADKTEGMINGSMAYDIDKLKPLYRLQTGKPGSSFALEVAKSIGLPKSLIDIARKRSNTVHQKTDELLARLETEREYNQTLTYLMQQEKDHFHRLREEYQKMKSDFQAVQKGILDDARKKAIAIIEKANATIERTIKEIKEGSATRVETKELRLKLKEDRFSLEKEILEVGNESQAKTKVQPKAIKVKLVVGTRVKIPNSDAVGEILEIRKDKAVVLAGIMKSTINLSELIASDVTSTVTKTKKSSIDLVNARANFVMDKDVRGMRGEEVIKEIDSWLDQAIMIGSPQLRLIHGKGDGILKRLIHDYYGQSPYIKKIRTESHEFGGEGVSILELA